MITPTNNVYNRLHHPVIHNPLFHQSLCMKSEWNILIHGTIFYPQVSGVWCLSPAQWSMVSLLFAMNAPFYIMSPYRLGTEIWVESECILLGEWIIIRNWQTISSKWQWQAKEEKEWEAALLPCLLCKFTIVHFAHGLLHFSCAPYVVLVYWILLRHFNNLLLTGNLAVL